MDRLISELLHSAGIYNTKSSDLSLHLQSHPEYPSLRAVTDTLDYFNINNIAVRVEKSTLSQLPKKFLAHLKRDVEMDFVLVDRKKDRIKLTWQDGQSKHVSIEEFKQKWNGTILAVEKDDGQNSLVMNRFTDTNLLGALLVAGILVLLWNYCPSLPAFYFSALSLAGLILSYFIQKEGLGIGNSYIANACSAINNNTAGCESVIKSEQGYIFGISLGDISLVYFTFILLAGSLLGIENYIFYTLSIFTLLAIVYTTYVQFFQLKKWCLLCLAVSIVIIGQFLILLNIVKQPIASNNFIITCIVSILLVPSSWITLKSLWQNSIDLPKVASELLRFKKNSNFFFYLINSNKQTFLGAIDEKHHFYFGATNPLIELTAITNPTCGYCHSAFEDYDYLLNKFPNKIKVNFVFNVPTEIDNNSNIISSGLIELYRSNRAEAYQAMKKWFANRDVEKWTHEYGPSNLDKSITTDWIVDHREWCNVNKINYTPATILNDSILPTTYYKIRDIEFFIEDLIGLKESELFEVMC